MRRAIEHHDERIAAVEHRQPERILAPSIGHWRLSRDRLERFVSPVLYPSISLPTPFTRISLMQSGGIRAPMVSPFNRDGLLDEAALSETVEFLVEGGAHGIISGGTTDEYHARNLEEGVHHARRLKEMIAEMIAARVPLAMGAGALRAPCALERASRLRGRPADRRRRKEG